MHVDSNYILHYKLPETGGERESQGCMSMLIPSIQLGGSRKRGRQHSTEADVYPLVCTLQHSIGFLFG